jgi:hypothetical protein
MTKITYEIVEHDGGWAYARAGSIPRPFRRVSSPAKRQSAPHGNKSSRETRRAFLMKTRKAIGTTR